MNTVRRARGSAVLLSAIALGVLGASSLGGPDSAAALPSAEACRWEEIGQQATLTTYHLASAFHDADRKAWFFGGADQAGQASAFLADLDLAGPDVANAVGPTRRNIAGVQPRYGSVCFFRPSGSDEGEIFCSGGSGNGSDGAGTSTLQRYDTATGAWVANLSPIGTFSPRLFHAGAYDPIGDVAVIHGGTRSCALVPPSGGVAPDSCSADVFSTTLLRFGPTGDLSWAGLGGSDVIGRVFLHSMVYDGTARRMLTFGGTDNGVRPRGEVHELDLSGGDPAQATWSPLATTGVPPARFAHAAAYDASRNWMIVYGGATRSFQTTGESTADTTWALDLGATPPEWRNLGATVGPLVGATMVYDPQHATVVMFGGRDRYQQGTAAINRKAYALSCEVAPPTPTPSASATPPGPPATFESCPSIRNRVPSAVISDALANPESVQGYGTLCNPNQPASPWNVERTLLALRNPSTPYHPVFNGVVWKCSCQ